VCERGVWVQVEEMWGWQPVKSLGTRAGETNPATAGHASQPPEPVDELPEPNELYGSWRATMPVEPGGRFGRCGGSGDIPAAADAP